MEYVIDGPPAGVNGAKWSAYGAQCEKQRFQLSGPDFGFLVDVVLISVSGEKKKWCAALVTESWQFAEASHQPRNTKVLKLIRGRSADVVSWIQSARSKKLDQAFEKSSVQT
jgi:hypothetical protein